MLILIRRERGVSTSAQRPSVGLQLCGNLAKTRSSQDRPMMKGGPALPIATDRYRGPWNSLSGSEIAVSRSVSDAQPPEIETS